MAGKLHSFVALGFRADDWPALVASLGEMARNTEVAETFETIHGRKYTLIGPLQSPSGRLAVVQTIWIVDRGEEIPRLVTAYPHEE